MSFDSKIAVNEHHAAALATADVRLRESERFHMGCGKVHQTLEALVKHLNEAGIDYAIIGGMALNAHEYRRETIDVDVLVRPDDLDVFTRRYVGHDYVLAFQDAKKTFKNVETDIEVKFFVTGEYPGNSKPKPVVFPDPTHCTVIVDGKRYINLYGLITLKLAAGINSPGRLRDIADAQDLIRILHLDEKTSDELHPYVHNEFISLWKAIQAYPAREE